MLYVVYLILIYKCGALKTKIVIEEKSLLILVDRLLLLLKAVAQHRGLHHHLNKLLPDFHDIYQVTKHHQHGRDINISFLVSQFWEEVGLALLRLKLHFNKLPGILHIFLIACWCLKVRVVHLWEWKVVNCVQVQFRHPEWIQGLLESLVQGREHVFNQENNFVGVRHDDIRFDKLLGLVVKHFCSVGLRKSCD